MHVIFYWGNDKSRSFHLIPKTPFRWMNPKVTPYYLCYTIYYLMFLFLTNFIFLLDLQCPQQWCTSWISVHEWNRWHRVAACIDIGLVLDHRIPMSHQRYQIIWQGEITNMAPEQVWTKTVHDNIFENWVTNMFNG